MIAVEGVSDRAVLETIMRRQGRDAEADGIEIVPIGGAHAIRRFVASLGSEARVRGLCDEREAPLFRRVLGDGDVFVCTPDLEGELIRALGVERTLAIVDDSFRTMQRQPAHRGRPVEAQLHRWVRSGSMRTHRYLPRFVEALDLDEIPEPLAGVLSKAR